MLSAFVYFLARLVRRERHPLGDDVEVGRDLQERVQYKWSRLGDGLFHHQHTDEVITEVKPVSKGLPWA